MDPMTRYINTMQDYAVTTITRSLTMLLISGEFYNIWQVKNHLMSHCELIEPFCCSIMFKYIHPHPPSHRPTPPHTLSIMLTECTELISFARTLEYQNTMVQKFVDEHLAFSQLISQLVSYNGKLHLILKSLLLNTPPLSKLLRYTENSHQRYLALDKLIFFRVGSGCQNKALRILKANGQSENQSLKTPPTSCLTLLWLG